MAQTIASFIDKDARLIEVRAEPDCCFTVPVTKDSTLETRFMFARTDGTFVQVTLADTTPPRLLGIDADSGWRTSPRAQDELNRLAAYFDSVRVSPREVLQIVLTNPNVPPVSNEEERPSITLSLDEPHGDLTPGAWRVFYFAKPLSDDALRSVSIQIDSATGTILNIRDDAAK